MNKMSLLVIMFILNVNSKHYNYSSVNAWNYSEKKSIGGILNKFSKVCFPTVHNQYNIFNLPYRINSIYRPISIRPTSNPFNLSYIITSAPISNDIQNNDINNIGITTIKNKKTQESKKIVRDKLLYDRKNCICPRFQLDRVLIILD